MKVVQEFEASSEIQQLFEKIKEVWDLPFVPNLYKAIAKDPNQLQEHVHQLQTLTGFPNLEPSLFHLIALTVAATRNCQYCINFHTAQLKKLDTSDQALAEMLMAIFYFNEVDQMDAEWNLEPDVIPVQ